MTDLTPEQIRQFESFAEDWKPLKRRFEGLSQDRRNAFVESVLGAYIQEAEKANGGDLEAARKRAVQMAETLMKRAERGPVFVVVPEV